MNLTTSPMVREEWMMLRNCLCIVHTAGRRTSRLDAVVGGRTLGILGDGESLDVADVE